MAKCEHLEFFSRGACSKVPNPLPDEFRAYCGSVLGRSSASLGQVSTLGKPDPSHPGGSELEYDFCKMEDDNDRYISPPPIWCSMTTQKLK